MFLYLTRRWLSWIWGRSRDLDLRRLLLDSYLFLDSHVFVNGSHQGLIQLPGVGRGGDGLAT